MSTIKFQLYFNWTWLRFVWFFFLFAVLFSISTSFSETDIFFMEHVKISSFFCCFVFVCLFFFPNPVANQPVSGSKWFQYFPRPCRLEWGWALADRSLFHIRLLPRCLKTQPIAPLPKSERSLKRSSYLLTLSGPLLDNEKGSRLQIKKKYMTKNVVVLTNSLEFFVELSLSRSLFLFLSFSFLLNICCRKMSWGHPKGGILTWFPISFQLVLSLSLDVRLVLADRGGFNRCIKQAKLGEKIN